MISDRVIARWRLRSQHLVEPLLPSAVEVVGSLLAVQAENPGQSAWAVACRTSDPSSEDVGSALADGRLIRTHVLRPTWHYVRNEDLGWLLDLTGPRVRAITERQLEVTFQLSGRRLGHIASTLVDLLRTRPNRTRVEVMAGLRERGVELDAAALASVLAHLELDRLICSGRPRDGDHTYALFADRIPTSRALGRDEALRELALRYLAGHGPATERDLSYWATLTLTEARRAVELAADGLGSFEHDGRIFWHAPGIRRRGGACRGPTSCRSSTRCTAGIRTRAGCSTPRGSCPALARPRWGWRSPTGSLSRPCAGRSPAIG